MMMMMMMIGKFGTAKHTSVVSSMLSP